MKKNEANVENNMKKNGNTQKVNGMLWKIRAIHLLMPKIAQKY